MITPSTVHSIQFINLIDTWPQKSLSTYYKIKYYHYLIIKCYSFKYIYNILRQGYLFPSTAHWHEGFQLTHMKVFSSQLHKKYANKMRTRYALSVQFKYGYFCSTKELKMLNPGVTTGEWRRRRATGNVAAVRREEAVIGSLGRKRGIQTGRRSTLSRTPHQPSGIQHNPALFNIRFSAHPARPEPR